MDDYWIKLIDTLKEKASALEPFTKNPKLENEAAMGKIITSLVTCKALLQTLEDIANKNQPALAGGDDLIMQALATEGSILLETDQIIADNQKLSEIEQRISAAGGIENLDQDDPETQEIIQAAEEIFERNSGEPETNAELLALEKTAKKRLMELRIIQESKKVIREMFEAELEKIDSLFKTLV